MSTATAVTPERSARRWGKRLGIVAGVALLAAGVALLLLPMWMSEAQGRAWILRRINGQMRGKLAVGEWSLGWFRGSELKDVTLQDAEGSVEIRCAAIHSGLTLWGMWWGNYDLGTTEVEGLQVDVVKLHRSTMSIDGFLTNADGVANGGKKILREVRGSLEAKGARLHLLSGEAGENVEYGDVKLQVGIPAADGPVHVQMTAASEERGLTVNATVPGMRDWQRDRLGELVAESDFEISGTKVPTGLACDLVGLDPMWEASIGKTLEIETLSNHASPTMQAGVLTVSLHGAAEETWIEANVLLRGAGPAGSGVPMAVLLPTSGGSGEDYQAGASLNWSRPLGRMLAWVNPVFDDVASSMGAVRISLGELNVSPANLGEARGTGRLIFPGLEFRRAGVFGELLKQAGMGGGSGDVAANAEVLRVRLEQGHFACEPWTLTAERRQKLTFTGAVSVRGEVDLLATIPVVGEGVGTGVVEFPLVGTVDSPVVRVPK